MLLLLREKVNRTGKKIDEVFRNVLVLYNMVSFLRKEKEKKSLSKL